jgi:hypothetical protein
MLFWVRSQMRQRPLICHWRWFVNETVKHISHARTSSLPGASDSRQQVSAVPVGMIGDPKKLIFSKPLLLDGS